MNAIQGIAKAITPRRKKRLIVAKLGIEDLGDGGGPWIPDPAEIQQLRDDLQEAMQSDKNLIVYHHGLQIDTLDI